MSRYTHGEYVAELTKITGLTLDVRFANVGTPKEVILASLWGIDVLCISTWFELQDLMSPEIVPRTLRHPKPWELRKRLEAIRILQELLPEDVPSIPSLATYLPQIQPAQLPYQSCSMEDSPQALQEESKRRNAVLAFLVDTTTLERIVALFRGYGKLPRRDL